APVWVSAPPVATRVRFPPLVLSCPRVSPVDAERVMFPPAVLRVLDVLANVRAPPRAVNAAVCPAIVCRFSDPPWEARSLNVTDVWAVTLMLLDPAMEASAPVERVPGAAPPSEASTVPPDPVRVASSDPLPERPGRMVMLLAGVTRSSRDSNQSLAGAEGFRSGCVRADLERRKAGIQRDGRIMMRASEGSQSVRSRLAR